VFIVNVCGGNIDASEPSGEGAVDCDVAGSNAGDYDGGKVILMKLKKI